MSKWEKVKLEDIAEIIMGQSPDSKYYNDTERGYKFLQGCSEFGSTYPNAKVYCTVLSKLAPINSILFSVRAPVGKINIADTNYCIGRGLAAIVPKKVNFLFLLYYLHILEKHYQNISQGTTFSAIGTKELKSFNISLPPLPIQTRIAEILSTADKAIEESEKLIAKYKRMKTGMMQDLLTKGIDENGNIRSEATHKFKDSPLGRIPVEWEVKKLEEVYDLPIRDFGSFSSTKEITFLSEGIPFFKSEMIEFDNIDYSNLFYIEEKVHKILNKSHVFPGNLLLTKIGSALGKSTIYDGKLGICNSNAAIAKISINDKKANKFYISYFLNFENTQRRFKNLIVSLLPRINLGDISAFEITLPPKKEQDLIANRIFALIDNIEIENQTLSKLKRFKTGLMNDLLSGKVEVVTIKEVINE